MQSACGCNGAKASRPWRMPCPECVGYISKNCPSCSGSQWIDSYECVNSIAKRSNNAIDVMISAIHALKMYNVLPVDGGWFDQPELFRDILSIFDYVKNLYDERHESTKKLLKNMRGDINGQNS